MESMKFKNVLFSTLLSGLLLIACSKDGNDGAIGPQGPQGEQGATGPAGPQGETGTANVIYSDWIPNGFSPGGGLLQKLYTIADVDEINSLNVILETSTVLVYGRGNVLLAAGDEVLPLPYHNVSSTERYTYTINESRIRLVGMTSNVANNDFDLFDDYRYVIIPGGVSRSGKSSNSLDFSKMTYDEVVEHFNIPK